MTHSLPSAPSAKSAVNSSVPSVSSVPAHVPSLKYGNDAEIAHQFTNKFADAQGALQRVLAFGVFAAHIKYNCLKHGQFGGWVTAVCGPQAYRSVRSYLNLTENVLKACGIKSLKTQVSKWQPLPFCHRGEFLLPNPEQIPAEVKPLREKVLALIENKTQRQLFFEFKQAEEDLQDTVKPKRGNPSGKGNPKETREAAALRKEKELRAEDELRAEETADWLKEISDDSRLGHPEFDPKVRARLQKSMETCLGYLRHLRVNP